MSKQRKAWDTVLVVVMIAALPALGLPHRSDLN